ncbi:hypothetical protein ACFXDJ_10760 [Streptomyces sp. NPDC059443]|uniref:hypothetical protein n=1 Tax=unclassified Streptomyces TaxID=2593676 RepID=UPI0036745978
MFAATCVLLASLGHVLMSGTNVPWWTMATAFGAISATGWLLAGRERGLGAITSATVAVQAVLHSGFALGQAAAAPHGGTFSSLARQWARYLLNAPAPGGHAMHGTTSSMSASMPMPMPMPTSMQMPMHMAATGHGTSDTGSMSPLGMLAGHLLAALVCGLWLAHGERGAFRVLRSVAGRLLVPLLLLSPLPAPAHRPRVRFGRDHRVRVPRGLLLADALATRGPPFGTAVV